MSVRQLAALARRHIFAVCLILLVTAAVAADFRYTHSDSVETATVALEPRSFVSVEPVNINENYLQNSSLITTCLVLALRLSGPQGEMQLHQAGVTGNFAVSVVNSSNADNPSYPYPELSVSMTDTNAGATHEQFVEAIRILNVSIVDLQSNDQISSKDRFVTFILSDSGPISQRGSLVRTYAALMLLALIAMFLMCRLLDRRSRSRAERRSGGATAGLHHLKRPNEIAS